eukprot:CAMPEP_0183376144 /NCGR_PEP_ID=MMETSP0164_2-20130417/119402_1 /TAXON_ID=221442 /ORGANISM="Coccolithus pelagicus ssp braarudi, Strain PLY182g" /LENGTH=173 /DNA_ID=CAMNT_0025553399 /DNA_START=257 /DNA_END=775 /DNA_ORIENTATION=+
MAEDAPCVATSPLQTLTKSQRLPVATQGAPDPALPLAAADLTTPRFRQTPSAEDASSSARRRSPKHERAEADRRAGGGSALPRPAAGAGICLGLGGLHPRNVPQRAVQPALEGEHLGPQCVGLGDLGGVLGDEIVLETTDHAMAAVIESARPASFRAETAGIEAQLPLPLPLP